jgi:hypothetical protein
MRQGVLIAVITEEGYGQHKTVTKIVRRRISKTIPIVVIPEWHYGEEPYKGDPDHFIYAYHHEAEELRELLTSLISTWKAPLDWLGAETEADEAMLLQRLEEAYRNNFPADEQGTFGFTGHNGHVVAEALRIKLLPSDLLKGEFEGSLTVRQQSFNSAEAQQYDEEVRRIVNMTDDERKAFSNAMMAERGLEPAKGGGVYVRRVAKGDDINGFAIDPVTLQYLITFRFGMHDHADQFLRNRLERIDRMKGDDRDLDHYRQIFSGYIFLASKRLGFTTPILQLFTQRMTREATPADEILRVAEFLLKERKFIPVTFEGDLLGTFRPRAVRDLEDEEGVAS